MTIAVVIEGDTDLPFVKKLVTDAGLDLTHFIDCGGKGGLDRDLERYNEAARLSPWLVLRDLDDDAPCAPSFLSDRALAAAPWMCFRIAVREIEAWLLADHEGVATYFRVDARWIPSEPDSEHDPTQTLVNLARKSKNSRVRKAMVPRPGTSTAVGPEYEGAVIEFGSEVWDVARASARSPSLRRARAALHTLGSRWRTHVGQE